MPRPRSSRAHSQRPRARRAKKNLARGAGAAKAASKTPRKRRNRIGKSFEELVSLQARLRAPKGCPWDREQTHASLRTYLVEETYEVLDALDSGDPRKFAEELGDLLLQIVFHAELAAEAGKFNITDVIEQIHTKMVRRHPHVFGNVDAKTSTQVLKNWENIKAEERAKEPGTHPAAASASILDGVPRSLPALLEAHQLTRRAAKVGFDWHDANGLFDKLAEETAELKESLALGDGRREEEAGDLLFVGVNLARFLGLDPEIALKKANDKFSRRFREMERIAGTRGQTLSECSSEELESLWNEVKSRNRQSAAGKQPAILSGRR